MNIFAQITIGIMALVFAALLIVKPTEKNRQIVKLGTRLIGYLAAIVLALFAGYWILWGIFKLIHHLWNVTV